MDSGDFGDIMAEYLEHGSGNRWSMTPRQFAQLQVALGKAHEEEVQGYLSEVKALREERDVAEAQVAVMGEALRSCATGDEWKGTERLVNATYSTPIAFAKQVCTELLEELASAPEVLLTERFKVSVEEQCTVLRGKAGNSELRTVTLGEMQDGEVVTGLILRSPEQEEEE
jgi:hypothetical protein